MFRLKQNVFFVGLAVCEVALAAQTNDRFAWKNFSGAAGGAGNSDGAVHHARFNYPFGVAVSADRNIFIADTYNHTIRRISTNGTVTTVAGRAGKSGDADGPAGDARFSSPTSVAVDAAGNLYVADTDNNTIRKIWNHGSVTTLAGKAGTVGSADGPPETARFDEPSGIAVDEAGAVYVSDSGNSTLRKILLDGTVTTLAGTPGQFGSADGTNSAAHFNYPAGLAVDNFGNIYVADLNNSTIRKMSGNGTVTTLAGQPGVPGDADGTNNTAKFFYPSSVAVDESGNVFVADTWNSTIRRLTPDGVVTTLAGTSEQIGSADGLGTEAQFNHPSGVAHGEGNLYVADTDNFAIRKIAGNGFTTTLAGLADHSGADDANGSLARFHAPYGLVAGSGGTLFVTDTLNHTVRKISRGGLVTSLAGSAGEPGSLNATGTEARFYSPYAITMAGNSLFVADTMNRTIRRVSGDGAVSTWAGSAGELGIADGTNGSARFTFPLGITADSVGNLFVSDFSSSTIRKINGDGVVTTFAGAAGQPGNADGTNQIARFNGPYGVVADALGNLYVTDAASHTVRKITSDGLVTTIAGTAGQPGSADGTNTAARFFAPAGIALDGAGNLFVADAGNATIRRVTSGGTVTTLAGSAGQTGDADGLGRAARFLAPSGISIDDADVLYVTDSGNNTVRKITGDGMVTTFAGKAGLSGRADITAEAARFFAPTGLAFDQAGNLFVADTYNSSIRKVTSDGAVTTLAGFSGEPGSANGAGGSARFAYPLGITADPAGNVYVGDSYNSTIRKVTRAGLVTNFAGHPGQPGSTDGIGSDARFSYPSGMASDSVGNIFVADYDNFTLRKITGDGVVTTLAGSAGEPGSRDGSGAGARFRYLNGIALDTAGNIYVADSGNATIRKVTSDGVVSTFAGRAGEQGWNDGAGSAARFDYPFGIAVDASGEIYVADAGNSTIRKISTNGVVTTIGGYPGRIGGTEGVNDAASFAAPSGLAVDAYGRVYVADSGNNRIVRGLALPFLSIAAAGSDTIVSWPSPSVGFVLQFTTDLSVPNAWALSTYSLSDDGVRKRVVLKPTAMQQFFRLISTD